MTSYRIERIPFDSGAILSWSDEDARHTNWPVVYAIDDAKEIYVGESTNVKHRMVQHLQSNERKHLQRLQVIVDETFNKSVCLDLESRLISYFAADGKYTVLNRNQGITNADYFEREMYREKFDQIFDELHQEGTLTRSIPEIVNSNLFKYSPFKALNTDQAVAIEGILDKLFEEIESETGGAIVVQGDPGTGKTIVAIYLIKLLRDIASSSGDEDLETDAMFSDYFQEGYRESLKGFKIGLVVPQQSLRKTIRNVFKKTPGLTPDMVLSQFEAARTAQKFDLLIVDETHRLGQRANQASAAQNKAYAEINERLFGNDDSSHTQMDWMPEVSKHQIYLLDTAQRVKPGDLPSSTLEAMIANTKKKHDYFQLTSQMRVVGGADYIDFVEKFVNGTADKLPRLGEYDFRVFDDLLEMRTEILKRDAEVGLSRLVAGYAWPWLSKGNANAHDIEIDGLKLRWNSTATDWVNSPSSVDEVGSIHTIQGYDLNYAGVIIGGDLGFDLEVNQMVFHRENYHDKKGKENNPRLGINYSDEDLLKFVSNIYRVLMTRGIRGTYVYICDVELRERLRTLTT